jgi:predicted DNA-binding transcriptional regulator YafY
MLMLLQSRGRLTAASLADELEVSERTIYRDLTALSTAGIPVYCERGPGGGISLIEEYQTRLTGLTPNEVRALFMLNIPSPLLQLGVGLDLRSAMRKLSASLPESRRLEEDLARERIHLDSSWWFQDDGSLPYLSDLKEAIWKNHKVHIKFHSFYDRRIDQVVNPYGLVAKANVWHLVYAWEGIPRVVRISKIKELELLNEVFIRPAGFNLAAFWEDWCREFESQPPLIAEVRISTEMIPQLRYALGDRFPLPNVDLSDSDEEGFINLELQFESLPAARTTLLGMGRAVEVLKPEALRKSVADFAQQVIDLYRTDPQS